MSELGTPLLIIEGNDTSRKISNVFSLTWSLSNFPKYLKEDAISRLWRDMILDGFEKFEYGLNQILKGLLEICKVEQNLSKIWEKSQI